MVEAVANLFLETLRDLLVEETKFLLGVRGNVEQVKRDLRSIHALLMKADRERRDSPTLKDYVSQLKDLAFKAETLLETYAIEVESKKEGQRSLKEKFRRYICIMCECNIIHEVGKEARDVISGLADLTNKLQLEFGQESSSRSTHHEDLRRKEFPHEVEHHFVGMEKDIDNLVAMVKDEKQRVVNICGMGGLGKTTLARKIYNHKDLQSYSRAWVCITQNFQPKAVLRQILKQLDSSAMIGGGMEDYELFGGIYKCLEQQQKCLIVVDDIWKNDDWEMIKKAFPVNCNVLLTSRSQNIANQECGEPYKLDYLTEDQGWELLQKIVGFGRAETSLQSVEGIGREIVRKCGRLPLSISVIGGILRQKDQDTLAEWKKVNLKLDSYLRHGEGVTQHTRVKEVLDLSYDALPYYLKPCFLYLACFAEDEEIETERLYRLWMAEGFISHQDKGRDETLRDVAERYLIELAMRCMVHVHMCKDENRDEAFHSCRLHDLMHDLCTSKAEEENLVKRIRTFECQNSIPSMSRLAISIGSNINMSVSDIQGLEKLKDLRSFMVLNKDKYPAEIKFGFKDDTIDFDKSQCLRILILDDCMFEGMDKLRKLIHLRYLSLRDSMVKKVPEFVCSMHYLQTLDLRVNYIRLANVIWKMKRLKHLFLPYAIEVDGGEKLRVDGLNELETLDYIRSVTTCVLDIPKLISLQELRVEIATDHIHSLTTLAHHMSNNKSRLRETRLIVSFCDFNSENGRDVLKNVLKSPSLVGLKLSFCNMSSGFPEYEEGIMCQNLIHLKLFSCEVEVQVVMNEFGKYPMLQSLLLDQLKRTEETLICHSNSFPQLKSLILDGLWNLKKWQVEERAMSKLTELRIENCSNLEKLPDGLRFISTLPKLTMEHGVWRCQKNSITE